jgi:hypothetical protein
MATLTEALDELAVNARAWFEAEGFTTTVLVGRHHVAQKGNAGADGGGRVVLVPPGLGDETWGPGKTQDFNGADRRRPIITRVCAIEVHFWSPPDPAATDKDRDSRHRTELLVETFWSRWHTSLRGQLTSGVGGFNDEDAETHQYGSEYVLALTVEKPVTRKQTAPLPENSHLKGAYFMNETEDT